MNFWRVLSAFFIIGFLSDIPVYGKDTMEHELLVASFSGVLHKCILYRDKMSSKEYLLYNGKWSHIYWPNYNEVNKSILFVAKEELDQGVNTNIYSINLQAIKPKPKKLVDNARYPSLSPRNDLLAFYRHPNQLWIQNLENIKFQKKAVSDIANYQPCVWISNTHLLYTDVNGELILFSVLKGVKQKTGHNNILPGALSPDNKKVLCGSSDGMKIYFYFPSTGKIELIKESKFRSMGTSFIWLPDGSGFLFTRQTWPNILRLNESRGLFLYMLRDSEETLLLRKTALFGGAFIPIK